MGEPTSTTRSRFDALWMVCCQLKELTDPAAVVPL
jgi:hypothetical protein